MHEAAPRRRKSMHYSKDKKINAMAGSLVIQGWRYCRGKKHGKLVAPNGRMLPIPGTPSDWRASLNFRRDVRRLALDLQP